MIVTTTNKDRIRNKDELDPRCPPPLHEFGRHDPTGTTWTEIAINMAEMIRQAAGAQVQEHGDACN